MKAPEFFHGGAKAYDLVSVDDNILNTEPVLSDDDLINNFIEDRNPV